MDQISEHINPSNQKNHHYDKKIKIIVNLGSKKYENNNNSTCQLKHPQNMLLMSIVYTPESYVSNFNRKLDKRKVSTSSIKSSSTLFSCSIRAMYNRVNRAKNKRLTKSSKKDKNMMSCTRLYVESTYTLIGQGRKKRTASLLKE